MASCDGRTPFSGSLPWLLVMRVCYVLSVWQNKISSSYSPNHLHRKNQNSPYPLWHNTTKSSLDIPYVEFLRSPSTYITWPSLCLQILHFHNALLLFILAKIILHNENEMRIDNMTRNTFCGTRDLSHCCTYLLRLTLVCNIFTAILCPQHQPSALHSHQLSHYITGHMRLAMHGFL